MEDTFEKLIGFFKSNPPLTLMYSGGYDSSTLLGAAMRAKADVLPVWVSNGFNRASEQQVRQQAAHMGCHHLEVVTLEASDTVCENPENRCYHCKGQIIKAVAGFGRPIIDGTTASDTGYRPGLKALQEAGVRSPLADLGITRAETHHLAKKMGIDSHLAELEGCLATRFNYRQLITEKRLEAIRQIEHLIIAISGDTNVRCRFDDEEHIRIEVSASNSLQFLVNESIRTRLVETGKQVALFVTFDLQPSRPNEYDKRVVL